MSEISQVAQHLKDMAEVARDIADRARGTAQFDYLDGRAQGLNAAYLDIVFKWVK